MPIEDLHTRNKEIGKVLLRARRRAKRSMRDCADAIGTSRQRYAGFETGKVFIGAVELEALMRFLRIQPQEVWSSDLLLEPRDVVIDVKPGETVRVVINSSNSDADGTNG